MSRERRHGFRGSPGVLARHRRGKICARRRRQRLVFPRLPRRARRHHVVIPTDVPLDAARRSRAAGLLYLQHELQVRLSYAQHLPLGQALREYAGAANKEKLLSLLLPVQRAAERCAWLKQMVDAGEILHPQAGGALPAGRQGADRTARWRQGDQAQGVGARLPHALQADLQPSLPVAWRRRVGRGRQRQVGAPEVAL